MDDKELSKLDSLGRYKDPADAPAPTIPAKGETYDVGGKPVDSMGRAVKAPAKRTKAKADEKAE